MAGHIGDARHRQRRRGRVDVGEADEAFERLARHRLAGLVGRRRVQGLQLGLQQLAVDKPD